MRRITVLIACYLINASTIPGLAAVSTLSKDVNADRAVSANPIAGPTTTRLVAPTPPLFMWCCGKPPLAASTARGC